MWGSSNRMPKWLLDQSTYDSDRWEFSKRLIEEQEIEEFQLYQILLILVSKQKMIQY